MDFKDSFIHSLQTGLSLARSISMEDYLPVSVKLPEEAEEYLPFLLGYGYIKTSFPYYYELAGLKAYCLIYTESGTGLYTIDNNSYSLSTGSLVFINCQQKHRIEIKQSPWQYRVYFMSGQPLPYLYKAITSEGNPVYSFKPVSSVPNKLLKLYGLLDSGNANYFLHSKFLLDILLETILEKKQAEEQSAHLPEYLIKIKQCFDENYNTKYSLDSLEETFHISKFQLCREFTAAYGVSPIHYLNTVRINAAKEALVYTDKRINEIGRSTGFDNTNHFIRLFKQKTGVTPLNYRKAEIRLQM
ncbi:hypothetical protein acsn021_36720 [Anaerocolumna cellulosilytica]|uniref:Uncharacterized protein n=1 Tax=Anaerocolumna cellulosilytica TaxID=433286 RepID=A0A6S6QY21_9FIRM|nr:AraC family transcriptional regulator [Anaerocolumna cellulosilytica]MBB5195059.1 AraC-like DNA-binding protein [Anaerocolumna cellulosilytica]BCJ96103.1 hypothetical protein acsn021_36720 [Anaerocolumna cellulosilytica]